MVGQYLRKCPNYGIGVKTGDTVVIDIDCPREDIAIEFQNYCLSKIGDAPIRFGKAPKRALYYRAIDEPIKSSATKRIVVEDETFQVEVQGIGRQSVIYGMHPETKRPYYWLNDSLVDLPFDQLTPVTADQIDKVLGVLGDHLDQLCSNQSEQENRYPSALVEALPCKTQNADLVADALQYLDPQDYEIWILVGYALKISGRQDALELFQTWSAKRPDGSKPNNYKGPTDVLTTFQALKPRRTSLNAIFSRAASQG